MSVESMPPFPVDAERESPPPTPPPSGTVYTTFWTSQATRTALGLTLGLALMFVRALIMGSPPSREAVAVAVDAVAWAWGLAFGISRVDTDSLRWR